MLYEKSKGEFSEELFSNPTKEYRGAPFFAWNCALDKEMLTRRIEEFKKMRFGGFFMHVRSGLATEYLGGEFMELVRHCVAQAKNANMLAYLYDEDRWPSGSAGGLVTKNKAFRRQTACFSLLPPQEFHRKYGASREPVLLAVYDLLFDDTDRLKTYSRISPEEGARGEKWYLYRLYDECSGWHNGYTYADILNPEAVDAFIKITHEAYKRETGGEFGKTVPAIFSDEPNYLRFTLKEYARDGKDAFFPFSAVFLREFLARNGFDILDKFPEVLWNLSSDAPSEARYLYYRTLTELMAESFCDKIGKWCAENGLAFTGHVLEEQTLLSQTCAVGEAMRHYRAFTLPGIDMLCNNREFNTAKQAQSAAHQYGREGVASELYGVTGWEFDFRGHKFQGDWQAALGVTLRVPHLSWASMKGSAKRDYPASIAYQSAWYQEYGYLEDHYARLNVALTRGSPVVRVAVLHSIESAWLLNGVREHAAAGDALDQRFADLTQWLLRGQIDFDFISESLLPELYRDAEESFTVGEMHYSAVLVPPLATIRKTTLNALLSFAKRGGRVLACACPACVDGKLSNGAQELYALSEKVLFAERDILCALESVREVSVYGDNGLRKRDIIYNYREDGNERWLFFAHCDEPSRTDGADCRREKIRVCVKGEYRPVLYDTLGGVVLRVPYTAAHGVTEITLQSYPLDSFLLRLTPATGELAPEEARPREETVLQIPDEVRYTLSEPNAAVLDLCEWSTDGKHYFPREEILRIDKLLRKKYGFPAADGYDMQPWCISDEGEQASVYLRFSFESETETSCALAYEYINEVWLNGKAVPPADEGYFTDEGIRTMRLPPLQKGINALTVRVPVSARISLENLFLLGDFGVRAEGSRWKIEQKREKLYYGSVTEQGMPFYGAVVTYKIPFACEEGDVCVRADYYNGALVGVKLDGKDVGKIVLPPYTLKIENVAAGRHELTLTLFASRVNAFGALHCCVPVYWKGPSMWYTEGNSWAYEYQLQKIGIMKKPILTLIHK